MNWRRLQILAFVFCALWVVGCGDPKSESSSAPTPAPTTTQNPTNLPDSTKPADSRLPDLTGAAKLTLFDSITYAGLIDISGNVILPVVGDPKVKMSLSQARSTSIDSGSFLVAFEDKLGFWAASLNSVRGTGVQNATQLDIIFSDDDMSFRVIGNVTSRVATVYYRKRASGENQCKDVKPTHCLIGYYDPYPVVKYTQIPYDANVCGPFTPPDIATPCRAYMDQTTNASVKPLGIFNF